MTNATDWAHLQAPSLADLEALARVPYLGEKRVRLYGADVLKTLDEA